MLLFYTPDVQHTHKEYLLSEEESKHAIRVLRLQIGHTVHLVNGVGDLLHAEIIDAHPKRTALRILSYERDFQKRNYYLHIAIAPTKNIDRLEWFIEKATEIGVDEITPIICEHSERKEVKIERLTKVAIAAMKQSLKAYLPKINPAITFTQFLEQQRSSSIAVHKAIAHCVDMEKSYLSTLLPAQGSYLILIGPEGDFSEKEITLTMKEEFKMTSLGESRLRTETAALMATAEISVLNRI
ncbi:16S rRNA (uracil(1498)-N(3))-methyltransferase [Sphingobacterium sp. lm-10]|uniref:16S rRNA (uracil(1498)-N(3))-methyltransferase n=1 Tax=Sphingobacterium sp. lm-10 TaxID=2944904 RepID=UPI0020225F73|nr:16S rRNA (uracil(1498)-N(3))-methyltransferase [Sphingobacterium sp. lm-10]MCL7989268.1 16S rRNA (uracil(1498)-N(3))-methyltransferase [Sphingobacterium sp. lm-10]